jgi:hypothetical protein
MKDRRTLDSHQLPLLLEEVDSIVAGRVTVEERGGGRVHPAGNSGIKMAHIFRDNYSTGIQDGSKQRSAVL